MAIKEAHELWQETLQELQHALPKATFYQHLAGSKGAKLQNNHLLVQLKSPFAQEWIQHRLSGTVQRVASGVAGQPIRVAYTHAESAAPALPPTPPPPESDDVQQHLPFPGFDPISSNYTQTPNQFFTEVVPAGPPVVVAVVAAVIHQTIGTIINWRSLERREWFEASNRELASTAGISPGSVPKAVRIARERGYIVTESAENGTRYRLRDAGEALDLPVEEPA